MKKRQTHRIVAVLLTVMISANLLSGCDLTRLDYEQTTSVGQAKTDISFSWWGNDPRHLYTMDGVDIFESLNEDIDVACEYGVWSGYDKRTKMHMNSHTEADVMQINYNWLDTYSPDGEGYYDLNELSDLIDLSTYSEADLAYGTVNGKLNAVPIALNTQTYFFNKDIFEQYGLEIPKTWEDLFTAAKLMRGDGIYPLGMVKKHVFLMLIAYYEQTYDKAFFDENGKLLVTEDEMTELLLFYKRLIDEKALEPIDQFDRLQLANGKLAGSAFWISDIGNYCESIEEGGGHPVLADFIGSSDQPNRLGWYIKPATMYAISATTEHPEEAAKLLDFLINSKEMAELQKTEKGIPVSHKALDTLVSQKIVTGQDFDANQMMLEHQEEMDVMLSVMEDEKVIDVFKNNMDAFIYDKATLEEAVSSIMEGIQ